MPAESPEPAPRPPAEVVTLVLESMRLNEVQDDKLSNAVETFRHVARWIPRSISPFLDLNATLFAAFPSDELADEIDLENYKRILKMHSNFSELIAAFEQEPDSFDTFVGIMVRAAGEARAQDTNNMRYEIANYIPLEYQTESMTPPITRGEKSGRGFSHPATAKLLCPLRYLDRLQENQILFKNQVENGTLKLRASDKRNWPSFLYPENTPYDELELDKGLFRGHVFIRTLRAIFTGKSSAFTGYRSASKRSQAELHKMREVFPEAVAYAAVQCYYALSSLEGWDREDRFFKLDVFFDKCIQLFGDPEDEWVTDTLKFLTSKMPALTRKSKRRLEDSEDEDESDGELVMGILEQRAARWQAAEEAAREAQQSSTDNPGAGNQDNSTTGRPPTPPASSPPASPSRGHSPSDTSRPPRGSNSPPSSRSSSPEGLRNPSRNSNVQASTNVRTQATQSRVPQPSNSRTSASQGPAPPPPPSANRGGVPPVASKKKNAGRKPAKQARR